MARRPISKEQLALVLTPPAPFRGQARLFDIEQFGAAAPKKKRVKRRDFSEVADRQVARARELIEAAKDGDPAAVWRGADAHVMVALFCVMHEHVYSVLPHELAGEWMAACSSATKMLREEFAGESLQMVDYLRQTFVVAKRDEARRQGDSNWRVGWRHCFMHRRLLTDYRVFQARNQRKLSR